MIQALLGCSSDRLAPLVRRHFEIGAGEQLTLWGTMEEVSHRGLGRLLVPLLGSLGVLVPHRGFGVPCRVRHWLADECMVWEREFHFPGRRVHRFVSTWEQGSGGACIERVRFGFGVVMQVSCECGGLRFEDAGYLWQIGNRRIAVPLRWFLGRLLAEERQEGDELVVRLTLSHAWFGTTFVYRGRFRIVEPDCVTQ